MSQGIDPRQFVESVIRPTLNYIGLGGTAAEQLMLGTALQESGCGRYLHQLGGPALGPEEEEPATHDDLWTNYLPRHPDLMAKIQSLVIPGLPKAPQMAGNLYYAVAMARLVYFRNPAPLPDADDIPAMAQAYKQIYNTAGGAATTDEYVANWRASVPAGVFP